MPTITVDENATAERDTGGGDKTIPPEQVDAELAKCGVEQIPVDADTVAAAHGDHGDEDDEEDAVLGTDADPDFVEHGNHTEEGEVVDECPYCEASDEQHDDGAGDAGGDDSGEGDG